MNRTMLARIGLGWAALVVASVGPAAPRAGDAPQAQVWALSHSKVYHCPKSVWFQKGEGTLMGECQALRSGYRPALGVGCGSSCSGR